MKKTQQPSIPQFVNNQHQWEVITNPFFVATKCKQHLLNLEQNKWILAISENFPKCKIEFLLSYFGLELSQEQEEGIILQTDLDPIDALFWVNYPA